MMKVYLSSLFSFPTPQGSLLDCLLLFLLELYSWNLPEWSRFFIFGVVRDKGICLLSHSILKFVSNFWVGPTYSQILWNICEKSSFCMTFGCELEKTLTLRHQMFIWCAVGWMNFITPVGGLFATIFYYSTAAEDYWRCLTKQIFPYWFIVHNGEPRSSAFINDHEFFWSISLVQFGSVKSRDMVDPFCTKLKG
jgi:hypothetical protein